MDSVVFCNSFNILTTTTLHLFNGLFSRTDGVLGWQWHQLDHMQIICTSLQTDNHSSVNVYRPDALPDDQPAVSKH